MPYGSESQRNKSMIFQISKSQSESISETGIQVSFALSQFHASMASSMYVGYDKYDHALQSHLSYTLSEQSSPSRLSYKSLPPSLATNMGEYDYSRAGSPAPSNFSTSHSHVHEVPHSAYTSDDNEATSFNPSRPSASNALSRSVFLSHRRVPLFVTSGSFLTSF